MHSAVQALCTRLCRLCEPCCAGYMGLSSDYNTTPTKVVLSCFGFLVGLWQLNCTINILVFLKKLPKYICGALGYRRKCRRGRTGGILGDFALTIASTKQIIIYLVSDQVINRLIRDTNYYQLRNMYCRSM